MKTHLPFSLALLTILSAGLPAASKAADQTSAGDGQKFYMVVVAEQANPAAAPALPSPDHPACYVAYDAGYIEAGDPIAGEKPPPAAAVAQALRATLASQNYLPATSPSAPSLLIVYHWGLIRRDSHQIRSTFRIEPNLQARLALVATTRQAGDIENFLMDRRLGRINPAFRVPRFLSMPERDLLDLARDDRYFVIVSAYDYAALTRRETKLLWRLKVSTRSPGESMAEALPALLSGGAPYFGRNFKDAQTLKAPLFPAGRPGPALRPRRNSCRRPRPPGSWTNTTCATLYTRSTLNSPVTCFRTKKWALSAAPDRRKRLRRILPAAGARGPDQRLRA